MNFAVSDDPAVLGSWREIARYLGKGVRTVQRWEKDFALPVQRPEGDQKAVFALKRDIDAWVEQRCGVRVAEKNDALPEDGDPGSASWVKARRLLNDRRLLVREISAEIAKLRQELVSIRLLDFRTSPESATTCERVDAIRSVHCTGGGDGSGGARGQEHEESHQGGQREDDTGEHGVISRPPPGSLVRGAWQGASRQEEEPGEGAAADEQGEAGPLPEEAALMIPPRGGEGCGVLTR